MKVAFAGTPPFARAALAALQAAGHEIVLVLTQPDRPAGRGMKLAASPVKAFALEQALPLAQPRGLRLDGRFADDAHAARDGLRAAHADVLVVAAYGLILPTWTLELPRLGALNIHASLLPRWRGAAPIQRAIEAGDARTGITIMQMDTGLDTGAMLCAEATPIGHVDTSASLHERLAGIGARLIVEVLPLLEQGKLRPTPQPAEGATYARKIDKAEAAVDWTAPAAVLERRLRAFDPFPGASSRLGDESLKLWRGEVAAGHGAPGEIVSLDEDGLVVACGEAALRVTDLQRPGGRRLAALPALAGLQIAPGMRFRAPD